MADDAFVVQSKTQQQSHQHQHRQAHQHHHHHHQQHHHRQQQNPQQNHQNQQQNHHHVMLHGHQEAGIPQHNHSVHLAAPIGQVGQQSQQHNNKQQQSHSQNHHQNLHSSSSGSSALVDRFSIQQQQQQQQSNGGLSLSLPMHHHQHQNQENNAARALQDSGAAKIRADVSAAERPPGHGRDDAWTEAATLALIDAWGERYLQLNRGNLKQKHWREVADEVNRRAVLDESLNGRACTKSDVQCKNRLDTLKKKYKIEKARAAVEASPSKWPFFVKLDELVGPSKKGKKRIAGPSLNSNSLANDATNNSKRLQDPSKMLQHQQQHQPQLAQAASISSSSKEYSAGMTDSCENGIGNNNGSTDGKTYSKKRKMEGPFKDLARAIIKFGEVYERIESSKQQQLMDLERQRMEFAKDMELQRMQLFMQTQVELAKMKHAKHGNTEHYL